MRKKLSFLLVSLLLCSFTAFSQITIKGVVVDQDTKEPLIGVSVFSESDKKGSATDLDGSFTLKVSSVKGELEFTYVGYKTTKVKASQNVGTVEMAVDAIGLKDVVVTSSIAIRRKTPVALSVVEPELIEAKLSTQEFPEILKSTPGVYATKQGGGFGDSRINLRGFENENIAVMINGVPMNDMEWGGIYWSNWAGLSDVTRSMQVQRGLGASKVSAPSVGGSINIVTKTTDAQKGGSVSYALGNDGYNKIGFDLSTGLTKDGWAVSMLLAKAWGDGYIQGTEFESYSYFLNIAKQINANHQLSYTIFGAPQWHNQRKDDMTIESWNNQPNRYRYNAAYGFDMNGQRKKGINYNSYHKPQMSLNHIWQINEKSSLSTSLYASLGYGYGLTGQGAAGRDSAGKETTASAFRNKWYATSNTGEINNEFRAPDGTFDYGAIYKLNQSNDNGSVMATAKNMNNHNWFGLLSTYSTRLGDNIDLYGGIDLRYYKGIHKAVLYDLYGGAYFENSDNRKNVKYKQGDEAWIKQPLKKGDVVYRNYDGYTVQYGTFGQIEYNKDALSTFLSASINNTAYWRKDHFYYEEGNNESDTKSFFGFTAKGGANYNLTEHHNVFANIGYISRAPFFSGGTFLQAETSNEINKDAKNEKIFSFELGYGFRSSIFSANLNLYRTAWMDKSMAASVTLEGSEERAKINLMGVDALHQGVELDFVLQPVKDLKITGMLSLGDWRWNSNASGYLYDSQGNPLGWDKKLNTAFPVENIGGEDHALTSVNLKDVKVGNSAQTTFALGAEYRVLRDIRFGVDYTYFARNYAGYKLRGSDMVIGSVNNYTTPWRMPSAGQLDAHMSFGFKFAGLKGTLNGNINNLLNNVYITDAQDGSNHDDRTAQVYYAFGRSYSIRLKVNF